MRNFWFYRAPVILWAFVLFALSSIPNLPSPIHIGTWDDKLSHFVAYAILGALLLRAVARHAALPKARDFKISLTVGILYGITDELHQYFVPGRYMEFNDFIADALGVIAGTLGYLWLAHRRMRRAESR
jgi:VanZ family protein